MSKEYDPKHRKAVIDGLRGLADFFEEHPDAPVPAYPGLLFHARGESDAEQRAEVDRIAVILGVTPTGEDNYAARRTFGAVDFTASAISAERMRRHHAEASYVGAVEPEAVPA